MSYSRDSENDLIYNRETGSYTSSTYIDCNSVSLATNNLFANNANITSVNLQNIPFVNNQSYRTFYNCAGLTSVTNINDNTTELQATFMSCTSLVTPPTIPSHIQSLRSTFYYCNKLETAPTIPNTVTDMYQTFDGCSKLTTPPTIPNSVTNFNFTFANAGIRTAPVIPNTITSLNFTFGGTLITTPPVIPDVVTNMSYTFYGCSNLTTAPVIPDSVTNMEQTFYICYEIVTAPIIPQNVTNLYRTFFGCNKLEGNVYIYSSKVENATDCFGNTTKTKYVYIPFKDANNNNTTTYNSFISAGYDANGTKDGVYLRGIDLIEYICRYYDSNIGSYVELYLYEFDKGNGKRYYTFENNVYTDVTEQVQVNEEVSSAFMPTYYAHRSSSAQPWTRDYFWAQSQFYYTIPSTTSDFVGYPYNFNNNSSGFNVYIQNMTSFGLTKYYNGKKVVVGEDTSGYINTYPYVLTGPEASSTSTKVYDYIYNYIAITRVHNRSLIYNSKRYFIYKLDRYVNKTYLAYTGEDTGTVFYCSNLTNSYAFCILNFNNSVSSAFNIGIYDTLDNCIYASYNIGKSFSTNAYIFEKAIRTPSLDTDTLPWQ